MRSDLAIALVLSLVLCGCDRTEPEIVIVPRGYTGHVTVIFSQKLGSEASYRDGKRVYTIPQSGVLLTQFADNDGWGDWPRFYYENITPENRIPTYHELERVP